MMTATTFDRQASVAFLLKIVILIFISLNNVNGLHSSSQKYSEKKQRRLLAIHHLGQKNEAFKTSVSEHQVSPFDWDIHSKPNDWYEFLNKQHLPATYPIHNGKYYHKKPTKPQTPTNMRHPPLRPTTTPPVPSPTRRPSTRRPTRRPRPTETPTIPTDAPSAAPSQNPSPSPLPPPIASVAPSQNPSPSPLPPPIASAAPSMNPSPSPLPPPIASAAPSQNPSPSPLPPPIASAAPSQNPSPGPSQRTVCDPPITAQQREEQLFAIIRTISRQRDLRNNETSQYDAFNWLVNVDEAQVCPDAELDVIQRYIAALLYFSTNGDNWDECNAAISPDVAPCPNTQWLDVSNVCRWYRIVCDQPQGRIVEIKLEENNLNGSLPFELSSLENLIILDFDLNQQITSSIPSTFGELAFLTSFNISENTLIGTIPSELFDATSLERIDITMNEIGGTIPSEIAQLENLDVFKADENNLAGTLPIDLPDSLRFFIVDNNELSGSLPATLQENVNLRVIAVGTNNINGTIPTILGSLSELETINLFNNLLVGQIPSDLGNLSNLQNLFLHFNRLTGTMPPEICALQLNQLTADCAPGGPVVCDCCTLCF